MSATALVTGAGRGLGAAIARLAAHRGYRVGVLDLDGAAAERVGRDLPDAVALTADTRDEAAVEAALDRLGDAPDLVVCNAGIVRFGPLLDLDLADWRADRRRESHGNFRGRPGRRDGGCPAGRSSL